MLCKNSNRKRWLPTPPFRMWSIFYWAVSCLRGSTGAWWMPSLPPALITASRQPRPLLREPSPPVGPTSPRGGSRNTGHRRCPWRGWKSCCKEEDRFTQDWADRRQKFHWVNDIEYTYGANARNREIVHLVICEESRQDHYEPLTPCLAVRQTLKQGQRPPAVKPFPLAPHTHPLGPIESTDASVLQARMGIWQLI